MPQKRWEPVDDGPSLPRAGKIPAGSPLAPPAKTWETLPGDNADEGSSWGDYAGMAVRGLGGFLGSEGLLPGAIIGGGADLIAQALERVGGHRDEFSLGEAAANAATSAIPFGKAAGLVKGLVKGAGIAGLNSGAVDAVRQYNQAADANPDAGILDDILAINPEQVARSTAAGGIIGAGGGLVAHGVGAALGRGGKAFREVAPDVESRAARYTTKGPGGATREGVVRTAGPKPALERSYAPYDVPDAPLTSPAVERMNAQDAELLPYEMLGETGNPMRPSLSNPEGGPQTGLLEVPKPIRRRMESKAREQEWLDSLGAPGASKAEPNPIPHSWSNGAPAELPSDIVAPRGRVGTLPNGLPDLESPLPVTLSGDSSGLDDIIPSNVRGGPANPITSKGYRTYKGDEPGANGDQLIDFLSPDTGFQANGSGATDASTEALNRAASFKQNGVQHFKVSATGERIPMTDPAQLADPWQHLGPGESVVRLHPDGRVEPVAGALAERPGAGSAVRTPPPAPDVAMGPAGNVDLGAAQGDPLAGLFDEFNASPETAAVAPTPRAAGPKPFVPAEHVSAWQEIQRRIADKPGATPPERNLTDFSQRLQNEPNPRKLWGVERKANANARARVGDRMSPPIDPTPTLTPNLLADGVGGFPDSGEAGAVDPELLRKIAFHAGGALTGGVIAGATSDDQTRLRNVIGASLLGGALPTLATNPQLARKIRYASLLAGGSPQVKNVLGGKGSTLVRALEEAGVKAFGGDVMAEPAALARETFSGDNLRNFKQAFIDAGTATPGSLDAPRWGQTEGVLGLPSRVMHAADEANTGSMIAAGLPEDEAKLSMLTSEPRSDFGQLVAKMAHNPVASTFMPFARTGMNTIERGLEHTPFVGELPAVKAMRPETPALRRAVRQGIGAGAIAGGAYLNDKLSGKTQPFVAATLGPLAVPYTIGAAMAEAAGARGDTFSNLARSPIDALRSMLPIPSDAYDFDPGRYLSSFVPGAVADASLTPPSQLSTSRSVFDPTIAKIPGLNTAVLPRKMTRPQKRWQAVR